ncbi:MAG: spore germination protein [Ruminococcaceae bacterium]|nr:spore germination protein [Oscillospiraceae bacterium]
MSFTNDYYENIKLLDEKLMPDRSFDIIKRRLVIGAEEITLYYIDGFVKDESMQKLMTYFLSVKGLPKGEDAAQKFIDSHVPYVEVETAKDPSRAVMQVMSGGVCVLGETFGSCAVLIDARTYPVRGVEEPESDRVMRGARDGFVETLIFNTALIRRRIRDTSLRVVYKNIGNSSKTDIAVVYLEGTADEKYVKWLEEKLDGIKADSLPMGHESLAECLVKQKWYNPFPKIRYTERPDTAAAQLMEGSVLILCDASPDAMILPTSIFDFLQETGDYYFPPFTGTYLRIVRHTIFWLTLFLVPLWYLLVMNEQYVPGWLMFIIPDDHGSLPLIAQLFLVEFVIDGLKLASMNTPSMLTNSLSVVGGLILGDFAVDIGWLIPEVILYMAFVAIANFTQASYELGYAVKFMRMLLLAATAIFGVFGFVFGLVAILALIATNANVNRRRSYLYPLIPFNGGALCRLLFRVKKKS